VNGNKYNRILLAKWSSSSKDALQWRTPAIVLVHGSPTSKLAYVDDDNSGTTTSEQQLSQADINSNPENIVICTVMTTRSFVKSFYDPRLRNDLLCQAGR